MNLKKYLAFFFIFIVATASSVNAQNGSGAVPTSKLLDAAKLLHDIKTLSADDMEGRSPDLPSMQKAREYVEKRFKESGVKPFGPSYRQDFEFTVRRTNTKLNGVNFLGQIAGKKIDRYIVITAHYDHDGIKNGQIFNGADDNASGTAALFAIAKYFTKHKPEHTLIFVAFDAEEKGLQGSRHFVANLPVAKDKILLNVNMDMLSRSDKGELYAAGTFPYPQFRPALEAAQKRATVKLLLGHDDPKLGRDDWTNQSDQASFHREKIPFIYFGVEDHPDYHKPTDDFEKIDQVFYVRAVETVIEAIKELDKTK